uniref:hypothetical protein n=1 Tax=Paenibacillus terrae TaxID=159743 RepID=UPI001643B1DB|nr:hypothetical protein [Paenibacillus terrae]
MEECGGRGALPKESGEQSPSQDAVYANAGPAWHMLPNAGLALLGRYIPSS